MSGGVGREVERETETETGTETVEDGVHGAENGDRDHGAVSAEHAPMREEKLQRRHDGARRNG